MIKYHKASLMTLFYTILLTLAILLPTNGQAQTQTEPITAAISINKDNVYQNETFFLTLTITTTGIQIRPKMDITNLPDSQKVAIISKFESLPVKRTGKGHSIVEIHRYRCRASSRTAGITEIAPTLEVIALQRRRAMIGSFWEERPLKLQIPAIRVTTMRLPKPPNDFSGAVGELNFSASIFPDDVAPGDLINLTTKVSGLGYTENITNFHLIGSDVIKAYPPEETSRDKDIVTYDQIIIPQSTNITAIPKIGLTYFDTRSGSYKRIIKGPFPLTFHEVQTSELEHFKPTQDPSEIANEKGEEEKPLGLFTNLMQKMGRARYKHTKFKRKTVAHLAPSTTSITTFEIPAETEINIISRHNNWIQVEHNQKRGWTLEPNH